MGNTFFVIMLLLSMLVLSHSPLSVKYLTNILCCTLPCLAITCLMSFAQFATNPFACSQVYKDLKDCLSTQVGHLQMHKRSPKPPGTLLLAHLGMSSRQGQ